jgi:hypothetical protein
MGLPGGFCSSRTTAVLGTFVSFFLCSFPLCSSDGNCVHGPPRKSVESSPNRRHGARRHHDATMSSTTATANNEGETPHLIVNICNELHSARKAGIGEALFRSFFDVNGSTQIQCASGPEHCTHLMPVDGSVHRCMNCGLKYHSRLACGVETLKYCFGVRDSVSVAPMLSPYGQEKLGQSSLVEFNICHRCQERLRPVLDGVSEGVPSDGVQEGVPALPPMIVPKTSTKPKKRAKVVFDWNTWLDNGKDITHKCIVVSEESENRAVGNSLTRLVGINVGAEGVIPIFDINLDLLRKIAARLSLKGCRALNKIPLCEALVTLFEKREKGNENEPMTNEGRVIHWNNVRILNVMFGTKMMPQLASRGQLLDKDDLDNGVKIDEKLFLDFLVEYNDWSNEAYGKPAYDLRGLKHPNEFDQYPSNKWEALKKQFNILGSQYEKSLQCWRKSGTHCDYDDLDDISPSGTNSAIMLYMHDHMQVNPGLLSSCTSSLPPGLSNQSGIRGRPTNQPPTGVLATKSGGRCGPGGKKKGSVSSNAASSSARLALESIASKNEAKTSLLSQQQHASTLSAFRNVRDDVRKQTNHLDTLFDTFVKHCGGDADIANERIKRVRDKGDDDDDDDDDYPDSQEAFISNIIRQNDEVDQMAQHKDLISEQLNAFLPKRKPKDK